MLNFTREVDFMDITNGRLNGTAHVFQVKHVGVRLTGSVSKY